ncbi:STAS domain-containing protein [Catellatospora sichuanensis]|uniref:STAS domain-containing protein n=1 Tax=Catellatospora sichuanensis TaxID=1969805 RepID=UPI001183D378|nr:STAS domain-containing protein [Catellatospora sichuanensis]
MTDDLALRLAGEHRTLSVSAVGALHADTAHRLPKVVLGLLRQYAPAVVRLDLSAVTRVDAVGVVAIVLCAREAARHGAAFTITGHSLTVASVMHVFSAGHLLPAPRTRHAMPLRAPRTGVVCRRAAHPPRPAGPHPAGGRP